MALTGTGERQGVGNNQFGNSISFPRGLAYDGETTYIFNGNKGFSLNLATGLAFEIVSGVSNFNNSEMRCRSATYHNNQVLIYGDTNKKIQVFNTTTTEASDWHSDALSYAGSEAGTPDLWGIASLDGVLYGVDRTADALYTISLAGVLTRVGSATEFGVGAANTRGLASYKGGLISADGSLDKIFSIDPATGIGTIIGSTQTLPDNAPEAFVEVDGLLYMAGSANDALFRLYDVLWDETIADLEVNEGGSETWDLAGISQDASAFSTLSTLPNWLSASGTDLVATNAPAVDADQNYDVNMRATRDGVNVDKTLRIVVKNAGGSVSPTPAVLDITVNPGSVTAGGIATATFTFDKPVGGFTDADVNVSAGAMKGALTDEGNNVWTLPVTAPSAGSGTVTVSVGADVVSPGNNADSVQFDYTAPPPPPITVPDAPSNLRVTDKGTDFIDLEWDASANNGGAGIEDHEVNIEEGASPGTTWVTTGSTNTTHRVTQLKPNTQYTIQVRSRNSEGPSPASNTVTDMTDMEIPIPPQMAMTPGAPTGLKIELTPTTAVLKWTAATDGGEVEEYEVSYAEGASLGSTWVETGSTSTRFFVKGLKRGTQYTFGVRGRNSEGAGAASRAVTQKTPIASLHNALFFKECVNALDNGGRVSEHGNASNIIRAVADNDYRTFSTVTDYAINIAVNGNPTRADAIFVKGTGFERHSAVPTGGSGSGWTDRIVPSTVKNWEGTDVSTVVAGFQHDLYLLDSHFTATSVRVTFTGTDVKITEIMLLEFGLEIDSNADFTEIATNFVDRTGVVHPDPSGGISYTPPIGGGRDRWQIDYAVKVVPGKTILETPEDFLYWRAKNRNHVFCMEPSRFPWRIFPAVFVGKSVPVRYRTDDKIGGEILNFRVAEQ